KSGKFLHLAAITTLAIPGIVLGLSYVFFFKGTFIYGTFAILILVNLVHFFASPYLMAYNSLGKANENLEAVGSTMGIGRGSILKDVLIPQTTETIVEMFTYFFVNCMVTISAVAFLATTLDMPLALLITDLDAQRLTECTAFVSLMILGTNIALKLIMAGVKKALKARAC
ncbi:MAG: ABC transporter permease subunit, partial [Raoultibacter sp.]